MGRHRRGNGRDRRRGYLRCITPTRPADGNNDDYDCHGSDRHDSGCDGDNRKSPLVLGLWQGQDLTVRYRAIFGYVELLLTWSARKIPFRPEGQGDYVVVLARLLLRHKKGHAGSTEPSVTAGLLPGGDHGQDSRLLQGDISQGLTIGGKLPLFVVFLFLVFVHGELMGTPWWGDLR